MDENLNSLESLKYHMLPTTFLRERSSTIDGGGGAGGEYHFKSHGPRILAPFRLTAQKSCPLQKCVPKKL